MQFHRSFVLSFAIGLTAPAFAQDPGAEAKLSHSDVVAAGRAALQASDWTAAAKKFQLATKLDPQDGTSWQLLGYSLHAMQKLDEALPVHKKAAEFPGVASVASYNVACVYALRGKNELALEWLEKAAAAGFDRPEHIENDPDMNGLRDNERFKAVVKKIASNGGGDRMQVYVITTPRKSARVAWFSRTGSPGQISIDFAPIKWQDKYDEMVGSEKMMGKKWRLGADFWTAMDTSVDLSIGGQNVPAGYYYLTLEQQAEDRFVLGVHDAAMVKKMKLDAYLAHRLPSGIEIPLTHSRSDAAEKELDIKIATKPGSLDHGKFRIAFGGHRLVAPVAMMVGKKGKKKAAEASTKKKVKF